MQYGVYQPKAQDCFVAAISSSSQPRTVLTESLYFDIKKCQFFILTEMEPLKNSAVNPYHEIRLISETEAQSLFPSNDARSRFVKQFLARSR